MTMVAKLAFSSLLVLEVLLDLDTILSNALECYQERSDLPIRPLIFIPGPNFFPASIEPAANVVFSFGSTSKFYRLKF